MSSTDSPDPVGVLGQPLHHVRDRARRRKGRMASCRIISAMSAAICRLLYASCPARPQAWSCLQQPRRSAATAVKRDASNGATLCQQGGFADTVQEQEGRTGPASHGMNFAATAECG
jgi:hypothetical protein